MRRSGANSPAGDSLADRWRAARPPVAGLHLDSAACSRQSFAALDAAAQHARHEAEVGGYVAAEAAAAVLDAGRAAVAALSGLPDAEVVFTTGSLHALDLLLGSWPGENRTLACLPGEYGPNLAVMAAHGFDVRPLPTLQDGRVALDDAAFMLADDPPDLVHLTVVASHRGVAQPLAMVAQLCTELKLPLVVDAAQGLGHVDCAVGADVTYASSRKWIAGPRGVGVLAVRPELMERLRARLPAPDWMPPLTVAQQLGFGEANVAARVGFSVALGEHLACGPQAIRARLAELGDIARTVLAENPDSAADFITSTLGDLESASPQLLTTVLTYINEQCNASRAAHVLHPHPHTLPRPATTAPPLLPRPPTPPNNQDPIACSPLQCTRPRNPP
ncbi:ergothioneine biosynthesis PLP-dependent enzyme EgtE, partial [Mycobacterium tuberculosis]